MTPTLTGISVASGILNTLVGTSDNSSTYSSRCVKFSHDNTGEVSFKIKLVERTSVTGVFISSHMGGPNYFTEVKVKVAS